MPEHLDWHGAPARLLDEVRVLARTPTVVGVTGPVGAGKSTLATSLSGTVISTDDYLPDYEIIPDNERDLPQRADLERLASDLDTLRAGSSARVPIWSHHEHRRTGDRVVESAGLIIVEGLFALHQRVIDNIDIPVFVEAGADTRWSRWEAIELAGERGWGVDKARAHFDTIAEPTFARYADTYRAAARFIVRNG